MIRPPLEFHAAGLPPALTQFANIDNPQMCCPYRNDVEKFRYYARIMDLLAFRDVARGHVVAWRRGLEVHALGVAAHNRS